MFEAWLPLKTPLERLMWLKRRISGGASWVWRTITGAAPLTLANAVSHAIKSLTQYGKCTQASTPTPDAPVDILCNNGALRYGALGSNLIDPSASNTVLEYYINKADGEVKPSPPNFMFANYMPVEPGKTYVAYGRAKTGNDLSDYNRVAWYDSNKNWLSGADYVQNRIAVVTAPANAAYARFSCNPTGTTAVVVTQELVDSYNWMFAEGTAEITPFVPFEGGIYVDGTDEVLTVSATGAETQTVNDLPMLLSVGDYADEAEIISGLLTHKVGICVFDGTENWYTSSSFLSGMYNLTLSDLYAEKTNVSTNRKTPYCTHFERSTTWVGAGSRVGKIQAMTNVIGTESVIGLGYGTASAAGVADFKAWLAAQYAAGTPVIVVYPLAEETTESVTAQPLHTAEGDNTVSVTSNVDPVSLSVEYASTQVGFGFGNPNEQENEGEGNE